jgi:hypothetical protein
VLLVNLEVIFKNTYIHVMQKQSYARCFSQTF